MLDRSKRLLVEAINRQGNQHGNGKMKLTLNRNAIRQAREAKGLTQRELGQKMGVSLQQIGNIENASAQKGITVRTLERIWEALEITDPSPFFSIEN